MREYNEQKQLIRVTCNACAKQIALKQEIVQEGCFEADYSWGYFSKKDGMRHRFDLCEDCYDAWIGGFRIPVTESENTEMI